MSLYDKLGLLITPNGVAPSKIFAYKPTNGSGDGVFDRNTTATRVNSAGLIENVAIDMARIDYPTNGSCPHLLLEPQSTNLETTSASGSYGNPPSSEILTIAPDGTNEAVRPVPDGNSDRYQFTTIGGTYSSGDKVTYSWYRKRFSTPINVSFIGDLKINTLSNCTQIGGTEQIETNINGYDRFEAIFSITDGSLNSILRFYFGSIIGAGNSSISYWGHQLEEGLYATSYIPTNGSAVTRVRDLANSFGDVNTFNSEEGVLFVEMAALSDSNTSRFTTISDGTSSNRVLLFYSTISNTVSCIITVGGSTQAGFNFVTTTTDNHKFALKYKANDFAFWVDGIEVATDSSGSVFPLNTLTVFNLCNVDGVGAPVLAKLKQVQVYKEALTDLELEYLTTYGSFTDLANANNYNLILDI